MRSALLSAALAAFLALPASAQRPTPDVIAQAAATPAGLIEALYDMVSFDAGPEPDWEMFRDVFLENALIVFAPSRSQPMRPMSVDGFIADWETFFRDAELEDKGFYETIADMRVVEFGGLAHAFVIAAITTDFERPGTPIPDIGG